MLFGVVRVASIRLEEVSSIRMGEDEAWNLLYWRLVNRPLLREYVVLEKRRGLVRRAILTPSDPARFIEEVASEARSGQGGRNGDGDSRPND